MNRAVIGERLVSGRQPLQDGLDLKQRTRVGRSDDSVVPKDRVGHEGVAQARIIRVEVRPLHKRCKADIAEAAPEKIGQLHERRASL